MKEKLVKRIKLQNDEFEISNEFILKSLKLKTTELDLEQVKFYFSDNYIYFLYEKYQKPFSSTAYTQPK
jgi:hypothetical protein